MKKIIFAVFLAFYSSSSFAAWQVYGTFSCDKAARTTYCQNQSTSNGSVPWRLETEVYACGDGKRYRCQLYFGGSPCTAPQTWNQTTQQCVAPVVCPSAGSDAGLDENAPTAPGHALQCFGSCAVFASEFFQRTDNNNWVILYAYTGQPCGPGDPLGEPDLPPGEDGPAPVNPNQPSDTDDDGTPDSNDGDIDGDGIPNATDTDTDGDGISDDNDPSPQGPGQQEEESSAHTSLDCEQTPSCTGDGIQCAQLIEIWRLRCTGGNDTEQAADSLHDSIISDVLQSGSSELDSVQQEIQDSVNDPSGIEMPSGFKTYFTALFPSVSCADISFNWKGSAFVISCSKTADIRTLMAYVMFFTTIVYLYHLARRPVGE